MSESPQESTGVRKYLKTFDCGCQWEVAERDGEIIAVNYEPELANIRCPKVWALVSTGLTKGVFQLETPLGQNAALQCKPITEEEFSDVISIIRPGVGDALMDGKALKQHYIDRKNGVDAIVPIHPSLEELLRDGYGLGLYQEDYMKIATQLAGFSGSESYALLKACAKKLPELMAKFKDKFIQGCITHSGLKQEEGEMIFGLIEAGQRYSFNKSHSLAYSLNALYFSAYPKSHFPRTFFLSELEFAKCTEDIGAVIDDALNFKVPIMKPDLRLRNVAFDMIKGNIYFGLGRIKGVGESKINKLMAVLPEDLNVPWNMMMWLLKHTASNAVEALIKAGALDFTGKTRTKMLFEFGKFSKLTEKVQLFIKDYRGDLADGLKEVIAAGTGKDKCCYNKVSLKNVTDILAQLENPPFSMMDSRGRIFEWENQLMGFAFTCSEVDGADIANCTCEEFLDNKKLDQYHIVATINRVKPLLTKGKEPREMAFIELRDRTQKLQGVTFPDVWLEFRSKLFEGNKVLVMGSRGTRGRDNSLVINKVQQI